MDHYELGVPIPEGGDVLTYDEAVLRRQFAVIEFFVERIAYNRALRVEFGKVMTHRDFWRSTSDAHLLVATISWCNVFGSYGEDLHWTKTTSEIAAQDDFRQRILSRTGFTQQTWGAYHRSVLDFRGGYVAHLDLHPEFNDPVPNFDPAIEVAYAYEEWVRRRLLGPGPVIWERRTLAARYAQSEQEARSVIRTATMSGERSS